MNSRASAQRSVRLRARAQTSYIGLNRLEEAEVTWQRAVDAKPHNLFIHDSMYQSAYFSEWRCRRHAARNETGEKELLEANTYCYRSGVVSGSQGSTEGQRIESSDRCRSANRF